MSTAPTAAPVVAPAAGGSVDVVKGHHPLPYEVHMTEPDKECTEVARFAGLGDAVSFGFEVRRRLQARGRGDVEFRAVSS
jgi:hypothetical protein